MVVNRLLSGLIALFIVVLLAVSGYAIDAADVVAIWLFDESDKGVVKDVSGNGHDGEIVGSLERVEGKFGQALDLPGTGADYVEVPDHDDLQLTDEITLLGWVKKDEPGQGLDIIGKDDGGSNRNYNIHVPGTENSGKIYLSGAIAAGSTVITNGEWHHVAGTWDGSEIKIYIDGVEENSAPFAGPMSTSDLPVRFGFRGTGTALKALIDELAIFNRALTEEEINNIINTGLGSMLVVRHLDKLTTEWAYIKCY